VPMLRPHRTMAQSDLIRLAESTLGHAVAEFGGVGELRQFGAIVIALLLAWAMTRLGTQRFPATGGPAYWSAGRLGRIALPLLASLLLIAMRKSVLATPAPLATVALELLASLALVRMAVYTLNYVFSPGAAVLALQKILVWTVWAGVALDLADLLDSGIDDLRVAEPQVDNPLTRDAVKQLASLRIGHPEP